MQTWKFKTKKKNLKNTEKTNKKNWRKASTRRWKLKQEKLLTVINSYF